MTLNPLRPLTDQYVQINDQQVLDKLNGNILSIDDPTFIQNIKDYQAGNLQAFTTNKINSNLEMVYATETITINFELNAKNKIIPPKEGFLVEVFLSGNLSGSLGSNSNPNSGNSQLLKLYETDLIDPSSGDTLSQGFNNFFTLELL